MHHKLEKAKRAEEMKKFYISQKQHRDIQVAEDKERNLRYGKKHIEFIADVEKQRNHKEKTLKHQSKMEMVHGVLNGLQRKIDHQEKLEHFEKTKEDLDEAYNQAKHLERVRVDIQRKNNLVKA